MRVPAATYVLVALIAAIQPVLSQATLPAAATPLPQASASTPPSSDAAEKHAKRTACLKDAKTRKLVGADKTAFLKSCIGTP